MGNRFAAFPAHVRQAIAATDPTEIFRTDINDRDPIPNWGQGPVTLLGDAAHAMTPNLGQGACQAIEDAVTLGRAVARDGLTPQALRTYEAARIKRANAVVRRSRAVGRIGQWRHPVATTIRDTAVRWTPDSVTRRQLARAWTFLPEVDSLK
jgi:2-polyprenyl-6-methoxyphenol hydroxylase-like FAD-dependent oxidoreductase